MLLIQDAAIAGSYELGNKPLGYLKVENSLAGETLVASQGFYTMLLASDRFCTADNV